MTALERMYREMITPSHGTIPFHIKTIRSLLDDSIEVRVIAQKDGALGSSSCVLACWPMTFGARDGMLLYIERETTKAIDRAISGWILDSETQQGWPPRDCIHDDVDGAETAGT